MAVPSPVALGHRREEGAHHADVARRALSVLRDTLNFIERECFDSETGFDIRTISAGADKLLRLLAIGKREDDARRERLRAGRPLPGDF